MTIEPPWAAIPLARTSLRSRIAFRLSSWRFRRRNRRAGSWHTITDEIDGWHCEARVRITKGRRIWWCPWRRVNGYCDVAWVRPFTPNANQNHTPPSLTFDGKEVRFSRFLRDFP